MQKIESEMQAGGAPDEERIRRAQQDPEVRAILGDPVMQSILKDMQVRSFDNIPLSLFLCCCCCFSLSPPLSLSLSLALFLSLSLSPSPSLPLSLPLSPSPLVGLRRRRHVVDACERFPPLYARVLDLSAAYSVASAYHKSLSNGHRSQACCCALYADDSGGGGHAAAKQQRRSVEDALAERRWSELHVPGQVNIYFLTSFLTYLRTYLIAVSLTDYLLYLP